MRKLLLLLLLFAQPLAVSAAPTAGSGVTITNPYAFWVQAGSTQLDGGVNTTTVAATTSVATGTAPSCTAGTGGVLCQGEGTAPTAATAVGQIYTDSTLHDFAINTNGGGNGIVQHSQPGIIHTTGLTASVSLATLCAATAGACNQAGLYNVRFAFEQGGTACTVVTAGSVTFNLEWTDNAGAHSATNIPMFNSANAAGVTATTFTFTTSNTTAWASGSFNLWSTGAAAIQYSTTYVGCTTGTGTYQLDAVVTRIE